MESYNQLLPERTREELPLPILAVQVTNFINGGIAIGTTSQHAAMDGIGLMRFIETWCAVHQGKDAQVMPVHDRSVISFQGHEEVSKRFVEFLAPKLSNISQRPSDNTLESRLEMVRKMFVLSEVSIKSLKRQVVEKSSTSIPVPSTFQVVTAYLWACIAKTKGLSYNDELTYLCFVTDCRHTLNLSVTSAYIGNCIYGTRAELTGSILASTDGLVQATVATARAIKKAKSEPLKGIQTLKEYKSLPEGLKVFVSGTLRFYDADFGWGKPERMEFMATNNHDVQVFILAGKEKRTIQVSLGLPKSEMDVFTDIFVNDLDAATCSSL
ncbi:hypothetical protein LUZ60_002493 [Juncus effusus]|nr:hypothetical protein LUZ60_002493 [Juncus effusus]